MASAGQVALDPVQFSAASHRSTAARQTVLDGRKASAGHVVVVPVRVSAASGGPAVARHTVPALPAGCVQRGLLTVPLHVSVVQTLPSSVQAVPAVLTTLVGQVVLVPVQVSARSHSLTAARHTVPVLPAGCWQTALLPLQVSVVHTLPSSVQTVPFALRLSLGQVVLVPVQVSATSHSPAAARHTAPAFPAGCVHVALAPLHTSVVHALPSSVQLVPAAFTVSGGQLVLWSASAMSWPMVAALPVEAFAPVAPAVACGASALSEAASSVPFELSAWYRSLMPDGTPIARPSLRPKHATSIVLSTVVVIDGVELFACPPDALMGLFVSTLEYALIPPATREDETLKA